MPGSRRRKRQMAANRRQLGRARRKIQREGRGKENRSSLLQNCGSNSSLENRPALTSEDEAAGIRGWWGSLYNWCHASLTQVCMDIVCVNCGGGAHHWSVTWPLSAGWSPWNNLSLVYTQIYKQPGYKTSTAWYILCNSLSHVHTG